MTPSRRHPPLVLCVDDDRATLGMLERVLRARGYVTRLASSLETALEAAARERPDIVVLDLHLEDAGGADLVDRIAASPLTAGVPIVLASGAGDDDAAARPAVIHFVLKPWTPAQIAGAVDSALTQEEPAS